MMMMMMMVTKTTIIRAVDKGALSVKHLVKVLAASLDVLSSVLKACMLEGKNELPQFVLRPPHVLQSTHASTVTHKIDK